MLTPIRKPALTRGRRAYRNYERHPIARRMARLISYASAIIRGNDEAEFRHPDDCNPDDEAELRHPGWPCGWPCEPPLAIRMANQLQLARHPDGHSDGELDGERHLDGELDGELHPAIHGW